MANKQMTLLVSDDFVVKTIKFTLSSADILGLAATPKLVIPGVSGKVLTLVSGVAFYHAGGTPYSVAAFDSFNFGNATVNAANYLGFMYVDGCINQATDQSASLILGSFGTNGDRTSEPIYVGLSSAATLGNGTVDFFLHYAEVQF